MHCWFWLWHHLPNKEIDFVILVVMGKTNLVFAALVVAINGLTFAPQVTVNGVALGSRGKYGKPALPRGGAPAAIGGSQLVLLQASTAAATGGGGTLAARVLGWAISGVSAAIYSPMIITLFKTGKTSGLSKATWLLQLIAFSISICYPAKQGYALSTYFDFVALTAQAAIIVGYVLVAERVLPLPLCLGLMSAFAACLWLVTVNSPLVAVASMQACASAVMLLAILPQIRKNVQTGTTGGWSPISAGLSVLGNTIRVFTTVKLTRDPILLAQVSSDSLGLILIAQECFQWSSDCRLIAV